MEYCVNDIANLYKHDFYCYVEMNCCLNGKRKIFPKNKQFHKLFKLNYIAVYLLCNLSKQKSTETRNGNEK